MGACPFPACGGCQCVGRKCRAVDTGGAPNTSRISISTKKRQRTRRRLAGPSFEGVGTNPPLTARHSNRGRPPWNTYRIPRPREVGLPRRSATNTTSVRRPRRSPMIDLVWSAGDVGRPGSNRHRDRYRLKYKAHWDGVPMKPAITTFGVGPCVSDSSKRQ